MLLYIGADHRGFKLKEELKKVLNGEGYQPQDMGAAEEIESDDYPDYAVKVAEKVKGAMSVGGGRGILICGSGAVVDIVANKFEGVRSVLGFSTDQVFDARRDDDVNVLSLPADFIDLKAAREIVKVFLTTLFGGEERHWRRLEKINKIELGNLDK